MNIIRQKIATAVKILPKLVKNNVRRKSSFALWYGNRKQVSNWFYLYLCYSSFLLDLLSIKFGKSEWMRRLTIKATHTSGSSFRFPLISSRNSGLLSPSVSYLMDYERYFSKSICFEQDDVIVDIGAHIGLFSIPLILDHPRVRVFAFEPDVYNYNCLCENLRSNNVDRSRFKAEPCALYDRPGEVSFSPGGHSTVGSVVDAGFFLGQAESRLYMVKSTTLEAVFKQNQINRCKLLKMDCEGSEYAIFENLSDEILARIDIIFAESHPVRNRNPVVLRDYLASKGFDVRGRRLNNGCWELFCERLGEQVGSKASGERHWEIRSTN